MFYLILQVFAFHIIVHAETREGIVSCAVKGDGFPAKESEYDVRPNLFIDKDNLLGTKKQPQVEHWHFSYGNGPNGPAHWAKHEKDCGGKRQSPIDIEIGTFRMVKNLPKLKWSEHYQKIPAGISIENNGHTIKLNVKYDHDGVARLEGGPLTRPYNLEQINFHWSMSDHHGSEHTINKKSYPMEMQAIHLRSDLNKTVAYKIDKGVAIVAYIFEISDEKCNEALTSILGFIDTLKIERDVPVELNNMFRLDSLIDLFDKDYITYSGSLTTPPCYESVVWLLSPYTLSITKKQLEKFRQVSQSSKGFSDNHRPIQPLNGRIVSFVHN